MPAKNRLAVSAVPRAGCVSGSGIAPAHMAAVAWSLARRIAIHPQVLRPDLDTDRHALHAVGAAMAAQRLGEDPVTVAFLGDGATSEGDAHEAMNLAGVERAPCIFFVPEQPVGDLDPDDARQYAAASLASRAVGYGMSVSSSTAMMFWRATP